MKNILCTRLSTVQVGAVVIAKWSEDNVWYRAHVDTIHSETCDVTFVDYGNQGK